MRRPLVCLLLAGALLALPAAGRAAVVRTVCASGCDFTTVNAAVTASSAGDGIEVMPGIYDEKIDLTKKLNISGPADGRRPVIEWGEAGATTVTVEAGGAGTTLSELDIRGTGVQTAALVARGAVTATDLDLTATDTCAVLQGSAPSQLGPGVTATAAPQDFRDCVIAGLNAADVVTGVTVNAPDGTGIGLLNPGTVTASTVNARFALNILGGTVRRSTLNGTLDGVVAVAAGPIAGVVSDSVITSTADDGGFAVLAESVSVFPLSVTLRNVTAIASGKNATALEADAQENSNVTPGAIDARNVIARGTAHDVFAQPGSSSGCGTGCSPGRVTIGYSNFRTADGSVDTTIGHNQSADPLLVNPVTGAGQDFHIASASSRLIGAGTLDPSNGPADRDGVAHSDPPAIGAYEYPVSPVSGTGTGPGTGTAGPTAPTTNTPMATRPTISRLAETSAVFKVARASTPLQGRTASASRKRGTVFSFRLDQPATVTVVIKTSARCHRATAATRGKPRCSPIVVTLTRRAHAGVNRVAFTGRIRGRPLKPGDYRSVFVATNAGGSSAPRTLRFRIVAG
ncbi:MAG TPA: hypothetical protein VFH80_27540 [Solirubrobacteraceae bacterium]|nr:hypothetical protein [Solirubrobacteraceae bacterium]